MSESQRRLSRNQTPAAPAGPDAIDAEAAASRARARALLRAADAAIERALSIDSEEFLRAARQSGGQ